MTKKEITKSDVCIAKITTSLEYIQKSLDATIEKLNTLDKIYATKEELSEARKDYDEKINLVKNIVFTACGVILLGVLYTWLRNIGVQAR